MGISLGIASIQSSDDCLTASYDATRPSEWEKCATLFSEMFAEIGEGSYIEPPLHASVISKAAKFRKICKA